jgi:carbon-monoxide dehydrogenase large subunit
VSAVGARVKRGDDPRLLTGRGRYVDDIALPRMVHAAFVRSTHAHARLIRVDLSRARQVSGVVGVLTGDEAAKLCKPYRGILLHYKGMKTGAMLPLAVDRVRYVGEPIAAIAAESRAAADDAAALIDVEYEPLPAVLSPDAALADGAPVIHPELGDNVLYETRLAAGDVAHAFAGAARVWERTFTTGRHTGVPLEPRGLLADFEPATRALTVWISTQVPHMMQAVLAELFGLREQRVRVVAPDVGGSFGIKIHVYQDDMAACALALMLGRPVKFVASRHESFLSDIHAREQTIRIAVAADGAGVLTAMRASITAAVGPYSAYPRSSVVEGGQVLRLLPGPYRVRHYDAALRVVAQNKVVTSQYRAVGHPIATAVTESMIDLVARDLGLDPAETRRRNLVNPEELPYTSASGNVYDSGSYQAALARLLEAAGYAGLRQHSSTASAARRSRARKERPSGSSPAAPSPRSSASPTRARAPTRRSRRSSPTSSASRSTTSRCCRVTRRWCPTAAARGRAAASRSAAARPCSPPGRSASASEPSRRPCSRRTPPTSSSAGDAPRSAEARSAA